MESAKLVHNPTAGEGEHSKKQLISALERAGYSCSYSSTKEDGWEKLKDKNDFIVLAGGDGTVRKLAGKLLDKKILDKKFPIGLLPFGTANNIARTLGLPDDIDQIIEGWKDRNVKHCDVGKIHNLKKAEFFLEGFGFGVFPQLMYTMKSMDRGDQTPEEELKMAQEILYKIVQSYPAQRCSIVLDGEEHTGSFLLCEIMNTRSVGPNLVLAPEADPGDGEFEVVLIAEDQRDVLSEYTRNLLMGNQPDVAFSVTRARHITLRHEGILLHADDELIDVKEHKEIQIELLPGVLDFLV
jgi:diacylglycerol kinase family enzyme